MAMEQQLALPKDDGMFYVTIQRDSQRGFLLGPYATHAEAIENVKRGKDLALKADRMACFDAFGTAQAPRQIKTVFGL